LADLADRIDTDRGSLLEIMSVLNVRVDRIEVLGGWGAEKLARTVTLLLTMGPYASHSDL
jgi:hypothetical protein